jgi:hypothetical protein
MFGHTTCVRVKFLGGLPLNVGSSHSCRGVQHQKLGMEQVQHILKEIAIWLGRFTAASILLFSQIDGQHASMNMCS